MHYASVVKGPSRFVYLKTDRAPNIADTFLCPKSPPKDHGRHTSEVGSVIHTLDPTSAESPTSQNGKSTTDTVGPGFDGQQLQVDSDCVTSPRSRKRSAKTASLPDSIPPDEDPAGSRHKQLMTETDSEVYPLWDSPHAVRSPSSIPHPVSGETDEIPFEKPESPRPFAPTFGVKFKSSVPVDQSGASDSLPDYETPVISPDTSPSKTETGENGVRWEDSMSFLEELNQDLVDTKETLCIPWDQSESLRVCDGSLVDTEASDNSEGPPLSYEANRSTCDFMANPLSRSMSNPQSSEKSDKHDEPKLTLEDGIVFFRTPPGILHKVYQIGITLEVILRKGKSPDWWELDLRGLPTLGNSESGYLYFRTNPGRGMEFGTQPFKRTTVVENCLMAQFVPGKSLVIPLRNCNAEHYGFINDYKINSVIHSEIFHNTSGYAIEYTAVCSVDLINHRFWSEQCSFRMFVHGGPDGKYSGRLDEHKYKHKHEHENRRSEKESWLYHLWLDPVPGAEIGVSRIEITCPPASLEMFSVHWEVRVPRGKVLTMPRIKNTYENEAEIKLREAYDLVDGEQYVLAKPWVPGTARSLWDMVSLKPSSSARTKIADRQNDLHDSGVKHPAVATDVTASLSVTEPARPNMRPKRSHLNLHCLWLAMKIFFQACWVFAVCYDLSSLSLSLYQDYTGRRDYAERGNYAESDSARSQLLGFCRSMLETYGDVPVDEDCVCKSISLDAVLEQGGEPPVNITKPEPELDPMQIEKPNAGIPTDEVMPLRDRIDYFLGWKGPFTGE